MRTSEELRESGLERTAFLIDRVTWRGGMACPDHEAWWKKKRESWATLGLDVVKELLARIAELEAKATADRQYMDAAEARIAELEAENVRQKVTIEAQSAIIKQAEAKVVELEAQVTLSDRYRVCEFKRAEQAEAELAEVQALRFDLQHKLDDARAALAERERQLNEAMSRLFRIDGHFASNLMGIWKNRARAEEGSE